MAIQEQVKRLRQGTKEWNIWRKDFPDEKIDLSGADLIRAYLHSANLSGADLSSADLSEANLGEADLSNALLTRTVLSGAYLNKANLRSASLNNASLNRAYLSGADLSFADLSEANLTRATLVETDLTRATLKDCGVYGISVWKVQLKGATQENLIITSNDESCIKVDNLKIAQFIYLLLDNEEIRDAIDTIARKAVLILGRFTPERKAILDALREKLRNLNFLPIVFDFERPTTHDFTETIMTLASLSCFIIADITNPKSSPLELQATVPNYMIPFVPIIQEGEQPFAMFTDLQNRYRDWVLDTLQYDTPSNLINVLERAIVEPALERQKELLLTKSQGLRTRHIKNYL